MSSTASTSTASASTSSSTASASTSSSTPSTHSSTVQRGREFEKKVMNELKLINNFFCRRIEWVVYFTISQSNCLVIMHLKLRCH